MVKLNFLSYNATSIRGKLLELNSHFDAFSSDVDVISITETWLNESVLDGEILFNSNYSVHRRDRDISTSKKRDGGGVMIAVNSKYRNIRRSDFEGNCEIIWIEVPIENNRKVFIGTVYLPPDADNSHITCFEDSLEKVCMATDHNDCILLFGDFNMSDALWIKRGPHAVCSNASEVCSKTSRLLEILSSFDLKQHNILPTCNQKPLDLVITNDVQVSVDHTDNPTSSTHLALDICANIPRIVQASPNHRVATYNFKKADFEFIRLVLSFLCWSTLINMTNVNSAIESLYNVIFAVLNECVPKVKFNRRRYPYWYSAELIALIKEKERMRRRYRATGGDKTSEEFLKFRRLRSEVKMFQKQCHADYVQRVGNEIKCNPKRFWSYVKSLKADKQIPNVITHNNSRLTTSRDIAKAFCDYFESVFIVTPDVLPVCKQHNGPLFRLPGVTPEKMKMEILKLKAGTSSGYGSIPTVFLKECVEQICIPLCSIFNLSVSSGEYPDMLKLNNVVPVYKQKGDKSCIQSYRPICIQPIISKLFERIINDSLRDHIKGIICDEQHGFCATRSTTTNLLQYKDFISDALDTNSQVHSIYTDFNKAFDTISHECLLLKLKHQFGVEGLSLRWFQSYLTRRFQRVVLNGEESHWVAVTSGVPQGSILGPSLFIMYVNDIPSYLERSNCLMFADDLKIYKKISSLSDCNELQNDLHHLLRWCKEWRLSLNLRKCFSMNFTLKRKLCISNQYCIDDQVLENVSKIKDLGVYFKPDLSFNQHITFVVNKAFRMLGFVKRFSRSFKDVGVMKTLYNSYVRSSLDYCSPVWSPCTTCMISKIERVQKLFVKYLCFKTGVTFSASRYEELSSHFQLTTLEKRREISDVLLFHKIINGKINCYYLTTAIHLNVPVRRTRHTVLFSCGKNCRILIRKNDFFPRVIRLTNKLDAIDFFHENCLSIKRKLTGPMPC